MNYGRFFSLDYESSHLHRGMAVYYYREVKDKEKDDKDLRSSRFPVYLTISKQSIDFRIHYYSDKEDNPMCSPTHLHDVILSLPISTNLEIRDRLTEVLAEAYKTNFPNDSRSSTSSYFNANRNYLHNLVNQLGCEIAEKNKEGDSAIFYYNLEVFKNELQTKEDTIMWFLRKLILDFIYDLEHTRVFQTHPDFEYIYIKLKENFFFEALTEKTAFYFYREILKKRFISVKELNLSNLSFYTEHLLMAEVAWTKRIRNSHFDEVFISSGGWFKHPEREMDDVYLFRNTDEESGYKNIDSEDGTSRKLIRNSSILSSKWYVKRYAFQNIFVYILGQEKKEVFNSVLFLSLFCGILGYPESKTVLKFLFGSLIFLFLLISWSNYIRKTHFLGLHVFIPRVLIAIVAGWVTIFLSTDMLGLNSNNYEETRFLLLINEDYVFNTLIIGISLITFFYVFYQVGKYSPNMEYGIKSIRVSKYHYYYIFKRLMRSLYFYLIAFLYSFVISKVFSILFEGKTFLEPLENTYKLYVFFAMFIGIFIQLTFEEKSMTEDL